MSIKGFAIVPPVLGAIRIGKAVVRGDRKLPQKDDAFTITTQVQDNKGWIVHRLHDEILAAQTPPGTAQAKLRSIPIKLAFDDPELNLQAEYSVFDPKTGRPMCAGDGEKARRRTADGVDEVVCAGPEACKYGQEKRCKLFARFNVQIEGQGDDLGVFVFRTTGFNSVRTLTARMDYLRSLTNNRLAGIPLTLRLRAKTSSNSYRSVVYFVDIVPRDNMPLIQAINEMKAARDAWAEAGLSRDAFEAAVRHGLAQSAFVDSDEDGAEVLESFTETPVTQTGAAANPPFQVDEDGVIIDPDAQQNRATPTGLAGLRASMEREPAANVPQTEAGGTGPENWHVDLVD